ncbi:MAG: 3-phosphoshikimate 1-carboxyvinyltransferase [Clostridiaceae bacterium]|nr:3-phosphoshikimate 1-carboxyvinyltransferase [Clostridiaceae bacterium]
MLIYVTRSRTRGTVRIPGSKSHTVRALFIASLAEGRSVISHPLLSKDAFSAVEACKAFGARIENTGDGFVIDGTGGKPAVPENVVDVGNSGTTLRFAMMTAGLTDGWTVFTGDSQIRRRPLGPLIRAMNQLGGHVFSTRGNDMAPVAVGGRLKGGSTELDAFTSQYLSSILITAPLLDSDTEIIITRLNEKPYVEMTMWWLDGQGIEYSNEDFRRIKIKGGQRYRAFCTEIPGDFSSATFFMVLAAVSGEEFVLKNLDMTDPQGDKMVLRYLADMGAEVSCRENGIAIKGKELKGIEIDMNATPDALPAMAVAGCFARGETRLVNVPQARVKETDRIRVMCTELAKMGADIEELPDGLVIRESKLRGCRVNGHGDHRIVMALTIAGLNAEGETCIETAEAVDVTFPEFPMLIRQCGGDIRLVREERR